MPKSSPSAVPVGQRYVCRVYLDGHADPEVFTEVKHAWVDGSGVLVVLHYWERDKFRYCRFPLSRVQWWQIMPMRFED